MTRDITTDHSNFTLFGITNSVERYTWTAWLLLILVFALLGGSTILVASFHHNAFKLHRYIVVMVQHVAACDLMIALVGVVPQIISLVANRNILHPVLSSVLVYLTSYSFCVSPLLICAMTLSKYLILSRPLRARSWSCDLAHQVCAAIWILSLCFPGLFLVVDMDDIYFDYRLYNSNYAYRSEIWRWLGPIKFGLSAFLPNFLIILTSVFLVKHLQKARRASIKSRGQVRWQGIVTVVMSAVVYCISALPYNVYHVTSPYVEDDHVIGGRYFHLYFYRAGATFSYFNVVDNFVIYCCTVRSFRGYLTERIQRVRYRVLNTSVDTGMFLCISYKNFCVVLGKRFNILWIYILRFYALYFDPTLSHYAI